MNIDPDTLAAEYQAKLDQFHRAASEFTAYQQSVIKRLCITHSVKRIAEILGCSVHHIRSVMLGVTVTALAEPAPPPPLQSPEHPVEAWGGKRYPPAVVFGTPVIGLYVTIETDNGDMWTYMGATDGFVNRGPKSKTAVTSAAPVAFSPAPADYCRVCDRYVNKV